MQWLRACSVTFALIGFLLVQAVGLAWTTRGPYGVDFAAYYLASRALQQGRDIYTLSEPDWSALAATAQVANYEKRYLYPPLLAGVLRPMADLPFTTALLIWRLFTIAALLVASLCLSQFLRQRWIDPMTFAAAAFFVPTLTTLYLGQANTFVLAALAAYLLLDQRRRPWLAGVALAFGILLKPIAIALVAYLAWQRDWKRAAALLVGLSIGLFVMLIVAGGSAQLDYVHSFFDVVPSRVATYPPNQSVFGFWLRLFTANPWSTALADLPALATVLACLTAAGLALLAARLCWPRRPDAFALQVGLVLVTSSLIVPTSWYHHFTIDLIALLIAWEANTQRARRAALLIAYALIGIQGLLWKAFADQVLLLSLATYGLLIVYGTLAARLWVTRS